MSERALICGREADMRVPPVKSRPGRCARCLAPVWIAASSPKADDIFCTRCAMDMIEPGDEVAPLTKRQIDDLGRALLDG